MLPSQVDLGDEERQETEEEAAVAAFEAAALDAAAEAEARILAGREERQKR